MSRQRLGAFAVIIGLLFSVAACAGDDAEQGTTAEPAGETDEGAPSESGEDETLTVSYRFGPPAMDPHKVPNANVGIFYLWPVLDTLVLNMPDGLQPLLAESWEFADDGSYLELKLREDVTFHDGEPFNAEAVKANLERAKTVEGSTVAGSLEVVESIEVVDEYTVHLMVGPGAGTLPFVLSGVAGAMMSPASLDDPNLDQHPVGSGPYRLVEFSLGDRAIFEAVDGYWDPDAQKVQRLELIGIADNEARLNALRTGQVDIIGGKEDQIATAREMAETGDYQLVEYPTTTGVFIWLNRADPVLQDVRVRQAMNYAIDREAIAEAVLGGAGDAAYQPFFEGVPGHDPELNEVYPYDPEKARDLLAEAGYADGVTIDPFLLIDAQPQRDVGEAVVAMLAEVGIQAEAQVTDARVYTATFAEEQPPAMVSNKSAAADPGILLGQYYLNESLNPGGIPEEFRELVDRANAAGVSDAERGETLQQVAHILVEDAWDVPIYQVSQLILASDEVTNLDRLPWANTVVALFRYQGIAEY